MAIDYAGKMGAEFADLRIETSVGTNLIIMDGKTRTLNAELEAGCGIRVFAGGAWGFTATSVLTKTSLKSAVSSAVKMAKASKARAKVAFKIREVEPIRTSENYAFKEKPSDVTTEEKLAFAFGLDKSMRSADSRIHSTNTMYNDLEADRIIANSFGTLVKIKEKWVLSACSAFAKSGETTQRGHASFGSVGGYELMRRAEAERLGEDAASQAIRLLESKPVPAGKFTCILDNKMTGMLAHEAFGHACEADGVLAGASILEGRIGEKVAHEGISLIDDPTIEDTFGHFSIDWEGVRSKTHVLVENGVLTGFLHNLETSSRMSQQPNGSARAEAFNNPPLVRMSNTYIAAGDHSKDELFEDLKHGLLIQGNQYG